MRDQGRARSWQRIVAACRPRGGRAWLLTVLLAALAGQASPAAAAPGDLDPTFGTGGSVITDQADSPGKDNQARAVALAPDGKIVAAGRQQVFFGRPNGLLGTEFGFSAVRYQPDGSLDTSFSGDGQVATSLHDYSVKDFNLDDIAEAVAVQPDGKVVLAGRAVRTRSGDVDFALVRYNVDGSLDTTFSGDGRVQTDLGGVSEGAEAIALQPDGKIVVVGYGQVLGTTDFFLLRYNPDGSLDNTFDGDGVATTDFLFSSDAASAVAVQPDGRIVAAGYARPVVGPSRFALARYRQDGSLDTSFSGDGTVVVTGASNEVLRGLALQPDGKILAAGEGGGNSNKVGLGYAWARLLPNGELDPTFSQDGIQVLEFPGHKGVGGDAPKGAQALAAQPDGKSVAVGEVGERIDGTDGGTTYWGVVRLNPDGSPDQTFSGDGFQTTDFGAGRDRANAVALQPDGQIVVAGTNAEREGACGLCTFFPGDFVVARYEGGGPTAAGLGVAVQGPSQLAVAGDGYAPDPFEVQATVRNTGTAVAEDVEVSLYLPAGLEFAAGEQPTGTAGDLAPTESKIVKWKLRASGVSTDQTVRYFAVATASNLDERPSAAGDVRVPGLFAVSGIEPDRGGNAGRVTVTVLGSQFQEGATAKLGPLVGTNTRIVSPNQLSATFDLTGTAPGPLPVSVTNPGGATKTASRPFTVVEGGEPDVSAEILAPPFVRVRFGAPATRAPYLVAARNDGLVDAENLFLPVSATGVGPSGFSPADATRLLGDGATRAANPSLTGGLTVPAGTGVVLPGLGTTQGLPCIAVYWGPCIDEALKALSKYIAVQSAYFAARSVAKDAADICQQALVDPAKLPACIGKASAALGLLKLYAAAVGSYLAEVDKFIDCLINNNLLSPAEGAALKAAARAFAPAAPIADVAVLIDLLRQADGVARALGDLPPPPPGVPGRRNPPTLTCPVGAFDPNDKVGPAGVGPGRIVRRGSPMMYSVFFENKPTATAAAQTVVVTDTLDPGLDATSFELGPMWFGDRTVAPPPGARQFATDVDLRPATNLIVRVNAGIDSAGLATWRFASLDPATGLPTDDPVAGFLPPNGTPPEGEGMVSYRVNPRGSTPDGTPIDNQAEIFFDDNDPIRTPVWSNRLDGTPPTSAVGALPATVTTSRVNVSWAGTDAGAGVDTFDVYVSEGGGDPTLWQSGTAETSATFTGRPGQTYAFYSRATDRVGNREAPPGTPDATTRIVIPAARLCLGQEATIVGTSGNDHPLNGTAGPDVIAAGDGNDRVDGGGGADTVCAGDGNDDARGGDGDDLVDGGIGNDRLFGDAGNDVLLGGPGCDILDGGPGRNILLPAGEEGPHPCER